MILYIVVFTDAMDTDIEIEGDCMINSYSLWKVCGKPSTSGRTESKWISLLNSKHSQEHFIPAVADLTRMLHRGYVAY